MCGMCKAPCLALLIRLITSALCSFRAHCDYTNTNDHKAEAHPGLAQHCGMCAGHECRRLNCASLRSQIKPNPHFMLFATQNPPGTYGGRKVRFNPLALTGYIAACS